MESTGPLNVTSYDETCPLLCDETEAQRITKTRHTPLPKTQLAALCSARLVDPISFTQVFPYVNEYMSNLNVTDDPSRIGFYSGLVESVFALAQLCSIYQWAQLSDVIGRRPVILVGIVGISIGSVLFGMSKTLAGVIIARCIGGLFSGNIAVLHSTLGEITDSSNQALAYPIFGLFWPLGVIIGPLLGGSFSNPATKFAGFFDCEFFRVYPYFLPCFIAALIGIFSAAYGYFYLDETLPSKCRLPPLENKSGSYGAIDNVDEPSVSSEPITIKHLLSIPAIFALSISGCALSFIATAFDVVFVLFCYSPIDAGGLAFPAEQIGYSLAIAGSISAGIQILFMPYLLRTFDHAKTYNFCMGLWPYTFIALPLLNLIATSGTHEATGSMDSQTTAIVWVGIAVVLTISRVGCLAYSLSMILVKENAPKTSSLAAVNGLVQFAMCFSRALSPAFVSSCFAFSIDNHLLGGHLWVAIMVVICLFSCLLGKKIPRDQSLST